MNERRVSLSDIARRAGVHATTVSLALRDQPRLPETTRRRIQALAREMGYRADPFVRALAAYRGAGAADRPRPTLAYVTNWTTRWGWKSATAHADFFAGARAKAKELGFRLNHFWLREPGLTQGRLSEQMRACGIYGVVIASHGRERGDALQLEWDRLNAVKIDYYPHQPALHNVTNHQSHIARLALQKATEAGYRRIGFVMHRGWDHAVDRLWTAGFLGAQQNLAPEDRIPAHLFPGPKPVVRWFNETAAPVVELAPFRQWLRRYRPEVVISKASFVRPALRQLGLRVPRDLAFVDLFREDRSGATAGVRQNHRVVGALAVELLAGQLQQNKRGVPEIPTTTLVEGTWFDGASCPIRRRSPADTTGGAARARRTP